MQTATRHSLIDMASQKAFEALRVQREGQHDYARQLRREASALLAQAKAA